ncbi:hypothetical protein Hamer_G028293 [Homarus americanus]|uniref:Uncharacterized protein n=1 Tax=Homarus americanus TaxID=6706 RepID=A0A8J5K375_HOMAM|nr:hypothetical protein Hamer_G028293 [Homarus americanus]
MPERGRGAVASGGALGSVNVSTLAICVCVTPTGDGWPLPQVCAREGVAGAEGETSSPSAQLCHSARDGRDRNTLWTNGEFRNKVVCPKTQWQSGGGYPSLHYEKGAEFVSVLEPGGGRRGGGGADDRIVAWHRLEETCVLQYQFQDHLQQGDEYRE